MLKDIQNVSTEASRIATTFIRLVKMSIMTKRHHFCSGYPGLSPSLQGGGFQLFAVVLVACDPPVVRTFGSCDYIAPDVLHLWSIGPVPKQMILLLSIRSTCMPIVVIVAFDTGCVSYHPNMYLLIVFCNWAYKEKVSPDQRGPIRPMPADLAGICAMPCPPDQIYDVRWHVCLTWYEAYKRHYITRQRIGDSAVFVRYMSNFSSRRNHCINFPLLSLAVSRWIKGIVVRSWYFLVARTMARILFFKNLAFISFSTSFI